MRMLHLRGYFNLLLYLLMNGLITLLSLVVMSLRLSPPIWGGGGEGNFVFVARIIFPLIAFMSPLSGKNEWIEVVNYDKYTISSSLHYFWSSGYSCGVWWISSWSCCHVTMVALYCDQVTTLSCDCGYVVMWPPSDTCYPVATVTLSYDQVTM